MHTYAIIYSEGCPPGEVLFFSFSAEYVWSEEVQISPPKMNLRKIVRKVKQNVSSGLRKGSYKTCNFSRSDSKKRRGLLPENSFPWFNLNQPCTRTSFSVRRRSVKGSNHGLLCLVILVFIIRGGQSRGPTTASYTMLLWILVYGAVSQGVKPLSS